MTADSTEAVVSVTDTATSEAIRVPKIPKNKLPLWQQIQFLTLQDKKEAMMTVNRNTAAIMSVVSAAVKGAVRTEVRNSDTPTAARTMPLIMPMRTIIPDIHSEQRSDGALVL